MKKETGKIIVVIILIILIITIFGYFLTNKEERELIDLNFKNRTEKVKNFKYKDQFVLGWLQVQGTKIDLPIFTSTVSTLEQQSKINMDISYAWRNINYKLGENRLTIVGHNILNVSSNPIKNGEYLTDFEELMNYVYYEFAKENMYVKYTDEKGKEDIYIAYAVNFINSEEDYGYSINNKNSKELQKYINDVRTKSIYDYDIEVNENDELLTLMTCTRFFGINSNKKVFKIDYRKVRPNELSYKIKVTTNENYKKYCSHLVEKGI